MNRYEQAKQMFAAYGVDTDAAIGKLAGIPVSVHCWQGDDVIGFDGGGDLSGGIQTTGNYPGRARNFEELKKDIKTAFSLMPGKLRLNLHASYAILNGEKSTEMLTAPNISRPGWSLQGSWGWTASTSIPPCFLTAWRRAA